MLNFKTRNLPQRCFQKLVVQILPFSTVSGRSLAKEEKLTTLSQTAESHLYRYQQREPPLPGRCGDASASIWYQKVPPKVPSQGTPFTMMCVFGHLFFTSAFPLHFSSSAMAAQNILSTSLHGSWPFLPLGILGSGIVLY